MRCSLPVEIIEHVIDMLDFDVRVLRTLALTCRDLRPRARFHLFHSIRFEPISGNVDALCSFLCTHPELAHQVQAVTVQSYAPPITGIFPATLFRKLPRLRQCKLLVEANAQWETPLSFHPGTLAFVRTTLYIQELDVHSFYFTSPAEVGRLIASFPALRRLGCSDIRTRYPSIRRPLVRHRPQCQIQNMSVSTCCLLDIHED